ncbi:hypothetical protein NMY22_g13710 [Coprinellus aureogranulatus]|nr:hypothetical protein NMY22_g13710 [Coprinellus aureogranulatus]
MQLEVPLPSSLLQAIERLLEETHHVWTSDVEALWLAHVDGLLQVAIANACIDVGHWPKHFKDSLSVIIPKPNKPAYSTPKAFRPIVLLNTLGKLLEKLISNRFQFDMIKYDLVDPNQMGGGGSKGIILLYHAYAFIHALFTAAGLVLEHDKSEAFHFTRARSGADRPIDLGFAPHTGATPLRPKKFWRYLGFYFDQRLTFAEHIRYYSTKALTTVMAMRMLGNSTRGLSPRNKHILYRACVVPIATYGHRLWFYEGAKNVGALKTLSSMQRKAAIWITGVFRTSPAGGSELLAGLPPIRLHLRKLSERAVYRTATLSDTHPLRSLMPEGMRKGAKPHYSTACWLTPLKREKVRDAISQTAKALPKLTESFQPCAEEAAPGTRLMDLYADQVTRVYRRENALDVRRTELNTIWNSARVRHDALLIGTDASVPKDKHFQVVAAYCWEGLDDYELEPGRVLAGRVLSTDAELTAIRFALCRAVLRPGCERIVLFTDSIAMARRAVDPSVHSGQTHSLAVCKALATWFSGHPERSILFVETPSKLKWGIHHRAHRHATGMAPVRSGGYPATSLLEQGCEVPQAYRKC